MSQDAPGPGGNSDPEETREREQLAVELARRYYVGQVSTPELALEFGVSRSTISRLISLARDLGCVHIEVRDPQHHSNSISKLICDKYGLSQVTAVTNRPGTTSSVINVHHEVARRAAADVKGLISDGITTGIAWGSTIAAVSEELTVAAVSQTAVVQLFGSGSPLHIELDSAGEVLGRFTHAWNASAIGFSVPAFFDYAETRTALWKERSVQRVLDIQQACDMAIFSVGSTTAESPSRILAAGYLNEADVAMLVEDKAIGDINSYFFDKHGNPDNIRINNRASGLPLDALRAIPTRLCVASGQSKAAAVLAALRGGYVSHLVADTALLRRIVELDEL